MRIMKSKVTIFYIGCVLFAAFGMFAFQLMNGVQLKYRYYQTYYAETSPMMVNDKDGQAFLDSISTPHGISSYLTLSNEAENFPRFFLLLVIFTLTLPLALWTTYKNSDEVIAGAAITMILGLVFEIALRSQWFGDNGFNTEWYFPAYFILFFILIQPEVIFLMIMFIEMVVLSYGLRDKFERLRILELREMRRKSN